MMLTLGIVIMLGFMTSFVPLPRFSLGLGNHDTTKLVNTNKKKNTKNVETSECFCGAETNSCQNANIFGGASIQNCKGVVHRRV